MTKKSASKTKARALQDALSDRGFEPVWPDRETISAEELIRDRAERVEWHEKHFGPAPKEFTCDKCSHAASCALAFDSYNTNGDCLASK